MADGRRVRSIAALCFTGVLWSSFETAPTWAAEGGHVAPFSVTVLQPPQTQLSEALSGTVNVTAELRGTADQKAFAFSLEPDAEWSTRDALSPTPAGDVMSTAADDSVTWLAQQYYNLPGRITVDKSNGDFDTTPEMDAYQVAIWSFTDPDQVDLNKLPAGPVSSRARALAQVAIQASVSSHAAPAKSAELTLGREQQYPSGERFQAHLEERGETSSPVRPAGELIEFSLVHGPPLRMVQTDSDGDATLDLPNVPGQSGEVQATWQTQMPAGTILTGKSGSVILFQPLPFQVGSNTLVHDGSIGKAETAKRFTTLAWDGFASLPSWAYLSIILAVIVTGLLGIGKAASAHGTVTRRVFWAALAGVLTVVVGGGVALSTWQSRQLYVSWAKPVWPSGRGSHARVGQDPVVKPVWVGETSSYQGQHPGFFSGRCAVDGPGTTVWLSARNRGTGQILALKLPRPTLITEIDVIPGWFDTEVNYNRTGKPAEILLFSDTGRVADVPIKNEGTFAAGPRYSSWTLDQAALPADYVYVEVTRIEGDVRTYAAIGSIRLRGVAMARVPQQSEAIDEATMVPPISESAGCSASGG